MAGGEVHDEVARLAEQIERLGDSIERCRKFILAAKLSMLLGTAWMVATFAGLVAGPGSLVGATAALIGGIVLFGSTTSTMKQLAAALAAAETLQAQVIGRMELRMVSGGRETTELHALSTDAERGGLN